jgi:hypothetical protein
MRNILCNGCNVSFNECKRAFWRHGMSYKGMSDDANSTVLGKHPAQYHVVHHKSHTDWPGMECGPSRWETAINCSSRVRVLHGKENDSARTFRAQFVPLKQDKLQWDFLVLFEIWQR